MKIFAYQINGHEVQFICTSRNTRNGFAHDAVCIIDGNDDRTIKATCHYYNRTWERYAFQTVCMRICYERAAQAAEHEKRAFMSARNYQRMTAKRKAEFEEFLDTLAGETLRTWCKIAEAVENHGLIDPPYPDWYGARPRTFAPSYFA